jgi:tRNA (guanine37-N1)-methyltransferase
MEIDVFTLFPEAFGWFGRQRHVANALAHGTRLEYANYRDHTPLNAGQVDDTPFGGGAGMVLRVDVVEAALRARYGRDPVELREDRRVLALTPGGQPSVPAVRAHEQNLLQYSSTIVSRPIARLSGRAPPQS